MLIDWFTIGAQVINFLILVWLLKRFLYQPILSALDARETRIAAQLAAADMTQAAAQQERDKFEHKNEVFDQQRAALLSEATEEAKAERQRLLDEALQAATELTSKRHTAMQIEAHNLQQAISQRTQQEVFTIARQTLTDLAGTSLEERMVDIFTRRLRELNAEAKERLAAALRTAPTPVMVRTTCKLPAAQRAATEAAIRETLGEQSQIQFEIVPELIGGIELTTNGEKVAWSIADYLQSLERGVAELLKTKDMPDSKVDAKAAQKSTQTKPESTSEKKPKKQQQ